MILSWMGRIGVSMGSSIYGNTVWFATMVHHDGFTQEISILPKCWWHIGCLSNPCSGWYFGGISLWFLCSRTLRLMYGSDSYGPGLFYSHESGKLKDGLRQIGYQLAGVVFITVWNAVMTSIICIFISRIVILEWMKMHLRLVMMLHKEKKPMHCGEMGRKCVLHFVCTFLLDFLLSVEGKSKFASKFQ